MRKEDFEKNKDYIWARWEKAQGMPLLPDFRKSFEADLEVIAGEEDIALKDLDGLLEDFFKRLALMDHFKPGARRDYFSPRKQPEGSKPTKRYQRPFEKRLYLVEFVMERHLMIANQGHKSVNYGLGLRKRIDWKQMCADWNKAYPNDNRSPEVLKVRYYRAIAEEAIQRAYIERRYVSVPMNVAAELYDHVKIIDPEGNERIGHIGSIIRTFDNNGGIGKYTMGIRLLGDELSSEKSSPKSSSIDEWLKKHPDYERVTEKQSKEGTP